MVYSIVNLSYLNALEDFGDEGVPIEIPQDVFDQLKQLLCRHVLQQIWKLWRL